MRLFDSHCHYNDPKFIDDKDNIIQEIKKEKVEKLVIAGYNLESSKDAIIIANKYENIYATVGISPNDLDTEINLAEINQIAKNKKVVAIGEIGLDYYWNKENKNIQKEIFIKQIEIANTLNLPIVIHTRDAINDTLDIIKNQKVSKNKGVFHCCPLNIELIKEAVKIGYYISFSGNITFKNSKNADKCILEVPIDKILIETDSPYLTPEPYRGQRNDSRNVKYVAKKIAEVTEKSLEEISEITFRNAETIFNIK